MSKSKIVLIAALAGMSTASPAFAQTPDPVGSLLPYHYELGKKVWALGTRKIPQVIGAKKVIPARQVVSMAGDGCFTLHDEASEVIA